ncbi:hypothetical protein SAMN04490243_2670 [Robiginitalea myxolifaciens]|uniref:Uncharacterized protein n=1 Tax=Robiginitalea myxolifaciens TaxID=400055 RepID=A0A1I6HF08_9FLAO|nr:hypothetical protein [Robiginitalea myxolifaciens]SFR53085.1 hypothetical protein SAMN04490243_2670 [Robiginitalea myxolifaciens]
MKFNWITAGIPGPEIEKHIIELEYQLRPRITRFLMRYFDPEVHEDFRAFQFDVDLARREIRISENTPRNYVQRVSCDFMNEIGLNCC